MSANLEKVLKELDLVRKVTENSVPVKNKDGINLVAPIRIQRVFDPVTGIWTDASTYLNVNEHSRA